MADGSRLRPQLFAGALQRSGMAASLSRHSSIAILLHFTFPARSVRRWQIASQGLALLFEVGTWPPHDGFRRMGWFNLWSALADDGRRVCAITNSPHPSTP
jgi:hypothetical protein